MADVPCNGCTACCRGPIVLQPAHGDDPRQYVTEHHPKWGLKLIEHEDGTCGYLQAGKCTIYHNRPAVCRAFDCRTYARGWGKHDPLSDRAVIQAGLER